MSEKEFYKDKSQTRNTYGDSESYRNRKSPPTAETNAELYYYKKQIDSHTLMVIVLVDGEKLEGTIEWYDREAIKLNRKGAPNLLLLKHSIKYMYKADEAAAGK